MAITYSSVISKRFTDNAGAHPGQNTFTAPAGSNRVLFIFCLHKGDQNTNKHPTSVTFGGVSATNLIPSTIHLFNFKSITYSLWYIKEASIPAGEQILANDVTDSVQYAYIFSAFGVDQAINPTQNVVEHDAGGGATVSVHPFGANSGKTALGFIIAQGESTSGDFTFTPDSGSALFAYDKNYSHGLAFINETSGIHTQAQIFDPLPNNSTSLTWNVTYANLGATANRVNLTLGLFLVEAANTVLTINQAAIEPGGTISGTYSGFTPGTAPTSPLVLSDGTNSINVAVTIDDTAGDGTGTFTGTVPSLPSAGNSSNYILFGNITATLDDA